MGWHVKNGGHNPILTCNEILSIPVACIYADISPSAVNTADPIANPFPVAAVVLPSASRASVRSRISSLIARQ